MERVMTVEEKIRRAEEIYERRKQGDSRAIATVNVNKNEKRDMKLLRKMIIQIIVCMFIYFAIQLIYNNQYVFSEDFLKKANEILSYDTNFYEVYKNSKNYILNFMQKYNNQNTEQNGMGGAAEELVQEEVTQEEIPQEQSQQEEIENQVEGQPQVQNLSQEEQDVLNIKNTTTFIKPVEGTISSKYGYRETATGNVPKNHTGTDIAAETGTKIKSATDGEVVLASDQGDFGKHLKIQIGEVSIVYAHCNELYVKQGDKVVQGQDIAEVGSTGNSTGPHLHFEIRICERTVNPQSILEL